MTVNEEKLTGVICHEQYGSSSKKRSFVIDGSGDRLGVKLVNQYSKHNSASQLFKNVFLPQGYPDSVSSDYLAYQLWDTVQAFASSITGTLASQAVLRGFGVGNENATVMAATMTWLLKDGAGMVGRILFAWSKGTGLDHDAKRWRLFADILNDMAIFITILGPFFVSSFTIIMCLASVFRSIVGVAGGCTRAALTVHQARRNNMADVSAKDGSQETLVNLTALICSLILVPIVSEHQIIVWPLFVCFTFLHLFANYRAVRSVRMESLNQARFHIIVKNFLESKSRVLDVDTVNMMEPVVFPVQKRMNIRLGVSMSDILKSGVSFPVLKAVYGHTMEGYLLAVDFKGKCVNIVLSCNSDTMDELQACFHAELIDFIVDKTLNGEELKPELQGLGKLVKDCLTSSTIGDDLLSSVLSSSLHYTESSISSLIHELHNKKWMTEKTLLGPDEWRAAWNFDPPADKRL